MPPIQCQHPIEEVHAVAEESGRASEPTRTLVTAELAGMARRYLLATLPIAIIMYVCIAPLQWWGLPTGGKVLCLAAAVTAVVLAVGAAVIRCWGLPAGRSAHALFTVLAAIAATNALLRVAVDQELMQALPVLCLILASSLLFFSTVGFGIFLAFCLAGWTFVMAFAIDRFVAPWPFLTVLGAVLTALAVTITCCACAA